MKNPFNRPIRVLLIIGLGIISSYGQNYQDSLDLKINELYKERVLPGFSVAIVNMDRILYQNSQGFADLKTKKNFTSKTIQCIASTTKTTIAYAVMKLIEEGRLSLDAPINGYLPFKVVNPFHKDSIIRIRHLVTHTSGIVDTENNYDLRTYYVTKRTNLKTSTLSEENLNWIQLLKNNKRISLATYFENIFSEKGIWYNESTFHNKPFGRHYQYSNVGAGLVAYIVERITNSSFDAYIKKNMFRKLKMKKSRFNENKVSRKLLAKSHITEEMASTPSLGFINYPDGGMYTNIEELSRYLVEMIRGYNGKSDLLSMKSFREMMSPLLADNVADTNPQRTFNNIGVFWQIDDDGSIKHYGGNVYGSSIYFSFDPQTNIGKILMTNCDIRASKDTVKEFLSIWRILDEYAPRF